MGHSPAGAIARGGRNGIQGRGHGEGHQTFGAPGFIFWIHS